MVQLAKHESEAAEATNQRECLHTFGHLCISSFGVLEVVENLSTFNL